MASEKPAEFKIWYRQQFLNNVCHVCKVPPTNDSIVCPKCNLVTYCGQEHLEDDADDHEDICEALKGSAAILGTPKPHDKAHLLGPEEWRRFRLGLVHLCSTQLGRPLTPWEQEICLFPPLCASCHKFSNTLIKCPKCFCTSWCTAQHRPKDHSAHCDSLILFRKILQKKIHVIKAPLLSSIPKSIASLQPPAQTEEISYSLLTEIATSPLTMLSHLPDITDCVIHVIGPEPHFEANNLTKWEVFLFNLRPSITNLSLVFVGPEIGPLPLRSKTIDGRTLTFTFHQLLYHEFLAQNESTSPNLVCALNPGLYRTQGFHGQDTWAETITGMFQNPGVPVLVTAYTQKEVGLDHDRIKKQIPQAKTIVPPSRNPFSSLRPLMNFVSDECTPVVFKNAFYTVLCA